MKQLRADFDDEFVKAITGRGEYKMNYPHLALSVDQWFKMTVKQRETYVKRAELLDIWRLLVLCLLLGKCLTFLLMMSY